MEIKDPFLRNYGAVEIKGVATLVGTLHIPQRSKHMNKSILIVFLVLASAFSNTVTAQTAKDETEVKDVIKKLFKSMVIGDSVMLRSVFYERVTLATILRDKSGNVILRNESSIDQFAKAVGTPHKEVWNEEIWDVKVRLDGDFAQVWCDYAFYLDKNFSHCGVNAFELVRSEDGWKIFHLADTRRKEGCNTPKAISDKYK